MDEFIEIPFGANDSELKGWEYTIPDDMEAEIKDGKIIVRQKENKDEKIRKDILALVKKHAVNHERCQMEAYLEKQKEQTKEYPYSVIENAISFLTERNDGMPKDEARNIVNAVISVIKPEHWPRYRIQQPAEWTGYSGIVIDKTKYPELTDAEWAILRGFVRVTGVSHFPITIIKETAQDFLAHLPVKWDEKDEGILNQIIRDIEFAYAKSNIEQLKDIYSKQISCLKSLRPSLKPTEEQKTALWNAIGFIRHRVQHEWYSKNGGINGMDYSVMLKLLESIYEEIKNK